MIKLMPGLAAAGLVLSLMSTSAVAAPAGSDNAQRPAQVVRVAQMPKYVKPQFKRKKVRLVTTEAAGTVIIDTNNKYLYLVEGNNRATRYGIGVGRDGFGWSGIVKIGRKADGRHGRHRPKCAAAKPPRDTSSPPTRKAARTIRSAPAPCISIRAAATPSSASTAPNQPWTIGLNMSSGCIRMMNADVMHLYDRAAVGTKVIVIGPGNKQGKVAFEDRGIDVLRTMFGG